MKRYIQLTLASLVAIVGITLASQQPTQAIDVFSKACESGGTTPTVGGSAGDNSNAADQDAADTPAGGDTAGGGGAGSICGATGESAQDIVKNVINAILVVLGMVAVIMIIIGGIRYTTSNGDASGIKGAKDTILYAVVGLVVAILSYAIVNFVLGRFS